MPRFDGVPFLQGMKYVDAGKAGIAVSIFFEPDHKDKWIEHGIEYEIDYEPPTPFISFKLSPVSLVNL